MALGAMQSLLELRVVLEDISHHQLNAMSFAIVGGGLNNWVQLRHRDLGRGLTRMVARKVVEAVDYCIIITSFAVVCTIFIVLTYFF